MQKPNLNPPIRAICTTADGATADKPVFVIGNYYDSALNATTGNAKQWYRKYSDGTIVQGGYREDAVQDAVWTVPFITPYTTTDIDIQITMVFHSKPTQTNGGYAVAAIATDGFTIHGDTYVSAIQGYYWEATGR